MLHPNQKAQPVIKLGAWVAATMYHDIWILVYHMKQITIAWWLYLTIYMCLTLAACLLLFIAVIIIPLFFMVHGTPFEIDLSEGEFDEYDEKGECPVALSKLQSTFKVVKKHSFAKWAEVNLAGNCIDQFLTYLYTMNSQVKKQGVHGKTRYV